VWEKEGGERGGEKMTWIDRVENEAQKKKRIKEKTNIVHTNKQKKANWIGHTLSRNCLLNHVIKGKKKVMRRRERRCKQLLGDFKKTWRY